MFVYSNHTDCFTTCRNDLGNQWNLPPQDVIWQSKVDRWASLIYLTFVRVDLACFIRTHNDDRKCTNCTSAVTGISQDKSVCTVSMCSWWRCVSEMTGEVIGHMICDRGNSLLAEKLPYTRVISFHTVIISQNKVNTPFKVDWTATENWK